MLKDDGNLSKVLFTVIVLILMLIYIGTQLGNRIQIKTFKVQKCFQTGELEI